MENEIAKVLLPLVNNREMMEILQIYADSRIAKHHKEMEQCHMHELKGHQEAIKEFKRFATLKQEVVNKSREA